MTVPDSAKDLDPVGSGNTSLGSVLKIFNVYSTVPYLVPYTTYYLLVHTFMDVSLGMLKNVAVSVQCMYSSHI